MAALHGDPRTLVVLDQLEWSPKQDTYSRDLAQWLELLFAFISSIKMGIFVWFFSITHVLVQRTYLVAQR